MIVKTTLQPFVFRDPDNQDEQSRWCLFVMARDEAHAETLAIAEIARRIGNDEDDVSHLPAELGGAMIRQIINGDATDSDFEPEDDGYAVLLIVKPIPADEE